MHSAKRADHDPPLALSEWGWRYHHAGIPTGLRFENERYLPEYGFYVSGFDTSPYGIEWMRFEENSPVHEIIRKVPHIAFEVDDLEIELSRPGLSLLSPPNSPGQGVRVAMIIHNGAPIELIQFEKEGQGKRNP